MGLEPSREDFERWDAAGLCVACGGRPQPARKDSGDHPTHHRCDPCWRRYRALKALRQTMLHCTGWKFTAAGSAAACEVCGAEMRAGEFGLLAADKYACSRCLVASEVTEAWIRTGADGPAILQTARVVVCETTDRPLCVVIRFPPAIPPMLALAIHLTWHLNDAGVKVGFTASAKAGGFEVQVQAAGTDAPDGVAATAAELACFAARVVVPRGCYRPARQLTYDTHGITAAHRLVRAAPIAGG